MLGYSLVGIVEEMGARSPSSQPGDLVHAGAPMREEAVLDLDAAARATYPLIRLPGGDPPPWAGCS